MERDHYIIYKNESPCAIVSCEFRDDALDAMLKMARSYCEDQREKVRCGWVSEVVFSVNEEQDTIDVFYDFDLVITTWSYKVATFRCSDYSYELIEC